jgi:4-hydroxy-3-methylbut-2-enyl diphosphate reductase
MFEDSMRVIRADVCGYCMGVQRAVKMAHREALEKKSRQVFSMGPLIHNPQALEILRSEGLEILDEATIPQDLRDSTVVIRAHGVAPQVEEVLKNRGAQIVDATCPRVHASQKRARTLEDEGSYLFIAGDRDHGEIEGLLGYAPSALVVKSSEEAREAALKLQKNLQTAENSGTVGFDIPVALLGQTTLSKEEYDAIALAIKQIFPLVKVIDTICGATKDRQTALKELCPKVDAVVVVGGRNSANTKRLYAIALEEGKPAWFIERPEEIPSDISRYSVVGLSAGASTPDGVIDQVQSYLESL